MKQKRKPLTPEQKERFRAYEAEYRKKNKAKVKNNGDRKARTPATRFKFSQKRAAQKGKEFTLSFEEYSKLIEDPCYYCEGHFGKVECAIGLDRLDNSLGYVTGNAVSCCYTCNVLRGDRFTPEETKIAVQAILTHRQSKPEETK